MPRLCVQPNTCPVLNLELTNEQREIQEVARKFTRDEIIPKATHHDQTGEVEYWPVMIISVCHVCLQFAASFISSFAV